LNVTPYVCTDGGGQCPGSDLSLTMTASPNPVLVNSNLVYTLNVSNAGPSSANNVVISQSLPLGLDFVATSNYPAGVSLSGTNLSLTLGTMPVYGAATVSVLTTPTFSLGSLPAVITSVATVNSTSTDPNPFNNSASVPVVVTLPSADLAVTMTATPPSILQGGQVTFNIFVTNNGPFTATGVVLTNNIPVNANFVSATAPGTNLLNPALVSLGTIPVGSNAVVTVTISPTNTGNFTATAQVGLSPSEIDPVSLNNSASATVTVGPSADLAVSAATFISGSGFTASPVTVVSGAYYTNFATVVNNGPSAAQDVVFSETIPNSGSGLNAAVFVSSTPPLTSSNGVITWNIGSLAVGASTNITVVLQAPTLLAGVKSVALPSTFTVFGQPGDVNTNNNFAILQNVAAPPVIIIDVVGATLLSEGYQPPNGSLNLGEKVTVELYLQNTGNISSTNLQATLQTGGGVSVVQAPASQSYGALAPNGQPVGGAYTFTTTTDPSISSIVATLQLTDGSASLGTASFSFPLPVVKTFWNTNLITIPATNYDPVPAEGPAFPYPSAIQVSNVTGYVSKVTVTVSNLWHTFPNDIGLLLVGPGTNVVLMGDAAWSPYPTTGATITFDSTAGIVLPQYGSLASGAYVPEDYNPNDFYTNYPNYPSLNNPSTNPIVPSYSTNLASLNGFPANGTWSLYAHDNAYGNYGAISNGWAVTITTVTPVNPTNELSSTIVASTNQVIAGGLVTCLLSVTNNGPSAVFAYLTNLLPAGLQFVSNSLPLGVSYTSSGQNYIYSLGSLNSGAGLTIATVAMGIGNGPQINTISAGVLGAAFNISSNSASTVTSVVLPVQLAVGISAAPNLVLTNGALTYTLTVTNLGPGSALNTVGSFALASLTNVVVKQSLNGATNTNGPVAQCNLGTLSSNQSATVVLTAIAPTNVGLFTNIWSVSTASIETNAANTAASVVVNVVTNTNMVPIIVAGGATLLMQNALYSGVVTDTVAFTLMNIGNAATTTNFFATLQSGNGVTAITTNRVGYGAISNGASAAGQCTFAAAGAPGATITNTLVLSDGTNSLGSVSFVNLQIPNYSSSTGIVIPQIGPGIPYPSDIVVSGLTNMLVSKATVTLNGFTHTFPHDVNVLLASPAGQELVVMGHAGGAYAVTNPITLTFDDAASLFVPANQLSTGTFHPTNYSPVDVFPGLGQAPAGDLLAVFNGGNPNGVWSLYVYDDTLGNAGNIGGWSLGLTTSSALLEVALTHSPDPVVDGDFLTFQISVTNAGIGTASSVVITDTLPATVSFSGASVSQGGYSNSSGTVVFTLGDMTGGAAATANIKAMTKSIGTITNNASVSANGIDLYLAESAAVDIANVITTSSSQFYATNSPGGLRLTLLGTVGETYCIQISSNLLTWTGVFTNTATSGSIIYVDSTTNAPERFYRAIHVPQ
jgi:uncharacterized repeat protein (TIGR01451 family)